MLKLAQDAPLTGLHLARALDEAELPEGVLNVVIGRGSEVGEPLVDDPRVPAISFTGSVPVGHGVRDRAASLGKRVQLELGGHNPLIVADDAEARRAPCRPPTSARSGRPARSARRRAGSTCRTTIYDDFRERLLARIDEGKVGDPADPDTEVGPLVNETPVRRASSRASRAAATRAAPWSPAASAPTPTPT